ncbi:uncharacterized protein LOC135373065 [Ornithodoros turicata]|uniref:uncharacterized protein LOC135373065 n=1 Tax=Ornithodoros turicata TaxID=34597 RepID=UPI0031388C92
MHTTVQSLTLQEAIDLLREMSTAHADIMAILQASVNEPQEICLQNLTSQTPTATRPCSVHRTEETGSEGASRVAQKHVDQDIPDCQEEELVPVSSRTRFGRTNKQPERYAP